MIWEAEHMTLGRDVAVKFLHHVGPPQSEASKRFVREARVAAALKHRNIVDILDFGLTEDDNQPYMVMERLEGRALAEHLAETGPLPVAEAARIVSLVLRGLATVHDAGMVHRDLKPENIFLVDDEDGPFPKLLDFGLSRRVGRGDMTQEGVVLGTPDYMSPEQAMGTRSLDARTDIYSVGVILYELLSGALPFTGETLAELLGNVVDAEPIPLSRVCPAAPQALLEIVARAMAKDRADRFTNAREMRTALANADLGMALTADSGLIRLSELPPSMGAEPGSGRLSGLQPTPPTGATRPALAAPVPAAERGGPPSTREPRRAWTVTGALSEENDRTQAEIALPGSSSEPPAADAATRIDTELPEMAEPTGDTSVSGRAPVVSAETLAQTMPSGLDISTLDVPNLRAGGARREDSVSQFVVVDRSGAPQRRAGAGTKIVLGLLALVGLAVAAVLADHYLAGGRYLGGVLGGALPDLGEPAVTGDAGVVGAEGDADAGALSALGAPSEDAGASAAAAPDAGVAADEAGAEIDAGADDAGEGDAGNELDAGEDGELDAGEPDAPRARRRRPVRRRRPRRRR